MARTATQKNTSGRAAAGPAPGSRDFMKAEAARIGAPDLSDRFSNEAVDERARTAAERGLAGAPVEVVTDAWYNRLNEASEMGADNPFQEAEKKVLAELPEHIRNNVVLAWQSPRVQRVRGERGMVPVHDRAGKPVELSGQKLYAVSRDEAESRRLKHDRQVDSIDRAQAEKAQEMRERIARDGAGSGLRMLNDGDVVKHNAISRDGYGADRFGESVNIGIGADSESL